MVAPNLDGPGYTKETIRVEYDWEPPHSSVCLIYGHSIDDCPKASKRVVAIIEAPKNLYRSKVNKPTEEVRPKPVHEVNVLTTGNSSKKTSKTNASTLGNGTHSFCNSFKDLNVDNTVTKEVDSENKDFMYGVQEEGQSSTPLVEKFNMFDQELLEGNCVLVDFEGKLLKKFEHSGDHVSEDEFQPVDNEMASFMASKLSRVGYGTNSLLKQ
uniref:Zinc knuckle CX2CX4HX4C n=1 Tax=Tanacetum cinerariifolium TaxID=118510 RepID=A0A699I9P2_TANCI|nr:zinc knuckle CX2CX4HX4C [Tanacetum cinerariifolium]